MAPLACAICGADIPGGGSPFDYVDVGYPSPLARTLKLYIPAMPTTAYVICGICSEAAWTMHTVQNRKGSRHPTHKNWPRRK